MKFCMCLWCTWNVRYIEKPPINVIMVYSLWNVMVGKIMVTQFWKLHILSVVYTKHFISAITHYICKQFWNHNQIIIIFPVHKIRFFKTLKLNCIKTLHDTEKLKPDLKSPWKMLLKSPYSLKISYQKF